MYFLWYGKGCNAAQCSMPQCPMLSALCPFQRARRRKICDGKRSKAQLKVKQQETRQARALDVVTHPHATERGSSRPGDTLRSFVLGKMRAR